MATKKTTPKAMSKSEILTFVADDTGFSKKEVAQVLDALNKCIKKSLGRSGPGVFALPGLVKMLKVHKPATKARPGVNPFTGENIMIKAKPASKVVKVRALKGLKDMV